MNFLVQSLIQDLENMGRYSSQVSAKEWQDKWTAISELSPRELKAVETACRDKENPYLKKAWDLVQANDPDPAKTGRKAAFEGLFKI